MNKYLTTTLPYINSEPHLGFALELIQTDILVRHFRLKGEKVFFNTGTDEHGAKIWEKSNGDPKSFCDFQSEKFKRLISSCHVDECNFIRTTDEKHIQAVQEFWKRCQRDIYKGEYSIKYCTGCELEKQDSELKDGKCPLHLTREIEERQEENYYFRLSKYTDVLIKHFESNPDFVVPQHRHLEALNFLKSGLKDISISRLAKKLPWGIPVPGDPDHVIYVWFDALVNYISALGFPEKSIDNFWPGLQFAGKDNLRQQSIIWSGMLLSAGFPPPKQIFIHGFLTQGGEKISKSSGIALTPSLILDQFPADYLRYWVSKECVQYEDTEVNPSGFVQNYNTNLAKGLGNLFSRVLKLAKTHNIQTEYNCTYDSLYLDNFDIRGGINNIWSKINELNVYIEKTSPFRLIKFDETKEQAIKDIQYLLQELYWIAVHLEPYLPNTSRTIKKHLHSYELVQLFPTVSETV